LPTGTIFKAAFFAYSSHNAGVIVRALIPSVPEIQMGVYLAKRPSLEEKIQSRGNKPYGYGMIPSQA